MALDGGGGCVGPGSKGPWRGRSMVSGAWGGGPGRWLGGALAMLGGHLGVAQAASPGAAGYSFAAVAALVAAGVGGVVLLAYAIVSLSSRKRRDNARRGAQAERPRRDSSASRSEPAWGGDAGRKVDPRSMPLAMRRSASIPRITDEVAAPRALRPEPPQAARARSAPSPSGQHRERVWGMLDEIRHVPLATRLAPIAGVPPKHLQSQASAVPRAPVPMSAPTPPAAVEPKAAAAAPRPASAPLVLSRAALAPPALPRAAAAPPVAPLPDSGFGSSARWSDEKRAELRRAVDRLRASRDPEPRRRQADAAPPQPPAAARRVLPATEPAAKVPLPAASVEPRLPSGASIPARDVRTHSRRADAHVRWVGPDEVVVVSGHAIGGMVYVGAANRFGGAGSDPALIDDELEVDAPGVTTLAGGLDAANSSYASLEPSHRGAYLEWLAGGRPANAPASFALIFFMGLERRVIECLGRAAALPELNRLAAEMRRLVETHGRDSFSLHHHATRLAALVEMQSMSERMYTQPVPLLHRTYDLPVELRLALGQVAHDQVPLPVAWALAWLLVDQTFHLRSPMTRCPEEFRQLFEARYGERFGAGLRLPHGGRELMLTYMPVSPMLASADGHHFAVDSALDIDAGCAAAGELRTLCSQCSEELFEYCQYLARHPSAVNSPDAELRLPAAIRPARLKARIADLRLACQAGPPPANLHEAALGLWGVGLTDKDSNGLLQALLAAEDISAGPRPGRVPGSMATGGP